MVINWLSLEGTRYKTFFIKSYYYNVQQFISIIFIIEYFYPISTKTLLKATPKKFFEDEFSDINFFLKSQHEHKHL